MYFNNFSALLAMDGHGIYVWSAYAVACLILLYNILAPLFSRNKLERRLYRQKKIKMYPQYVKSSTFPINSASTPEEKQR